MKVQPKWILLTAAVALTLGSAWAFGLGEEQGGPPPGPEPGMMGMPEPPDPHEELGLTEEQERKLRALRSEAAKAGIRARSDLMLKQMELDELLQADEPDRAAIDRKLRELSDSRHAWMKQRIDHRLAMRGLLTPEQRTKLRKMIHRHHPRRVMGEGWHDRPGMQRRHRSGGGPGFRRGPGFGPGPGFGSGPCLGPGPCFGPDSDWDPDFEPEPPLEE